MQNYKTTTASLGTDQSALFEQWPKVLTYSWYLLDCGCERILILPELTTAPWESQQNRKAVSLLKGFSPLHCSQAVVMEHFWDQSNVYILILRKDKFPTVLNFTTTFKASIAVKFLLHGLLYID